MIVTRIKNTHIIHLPLIGGIVFAMAFVLLISILAFFAPMPSVHAMELSVSSQGTCAMAPTVEHCNHQDPMLEGCSADAHTIAYEDFLSPSTGSLLARVERRYSPACHSYWGRMVEAPAGRRGLSIFLAMKGGPPQVSTTTGTVVFTQMAFLACPVPQMALIIGTMSLRDGENPAVAGSSGHAALLAAIPAPINCPLA